MSPPEVFTSQTSEISDITCPVDPLTGKRTVKNKNTQTLVYDLPLSQSPNRKKYTTKLSCGAISSEASTLVNVLFDRNTNTFTGKLAVEGYVTKPTLPRLSQGGVFASSSAQLTVQTLAQQPSGSFNLASIDGSAALPSGYKPTNSTTIIQYQVKERRSPKVLAQGNLFQITSTLDRQIKWERDSLDFTGVKEGTFSLRFGKFTNKRGHLSLEFKQGKIWKSEDSGFFEGWLPAVGTSSNFRLDSSRLNQSFNSDFHYNLGNFGKPVILSLNWKSRILD
ncbi:hypothetical protein [Merismopedia glauca]|uniref:Uncharacterized protein n=1 Tax=Merismopedia glauca CCAP 1448/3 TaxID=1296344 RepID=A0A2T1C9Q7_9CYAN|nr:hypothetical protein [Merismopedia glauca]PSB04995.1 hypothetical protein C7B64_01120 [Merismopedia glauca CCAP 1448/3]